MLIVGGKNSSNTTKLHATVKRVQPRSYHIETEDEIQPEWLKGLSVDRHSRGCIYPSFNNRKSGEACKKL